MLVQTRTRKKVDKCFSDETIIRLHILAQEYGENEGQLQELLFAFLRLASLEHSLDTIEKSLAIRNLFSSELEEECK